MNRHPAPAYGLALLVSVAVVLGALHLAHRKAQAIATERGQQLQMFQQMPDRVIESEDQKYAGDLLPADGAALWQYPPTNLVILKLGRATATIPSFPHVVIMRAGGSPALVITAGSHGAAVSADFFDSDGKIVARLQTNHFVVNRNNHFSLDRPDKSTLRVWDQEGKKSLDVRFETPYLIKLTGRLRFPNGKEVVIDEKEGLFSNDIKTMGVVDYVVP